MDCVFCSIIASEDAMVVDSDDQAVAFLDINPMQRGHTLVVPRRHVENFVDDADALCQVAPLAARVAQHLRDTLGADGLNMFTSQGSAAGQEVFHAHLHLVPRYADDPGLRALFRVSGDKNVATDEELTELYEQLTGE